MTPATAIATVALFVALGGSSLAAANYIDGHTIKDGSIPVTKLTGAAVASLSGVRDVSLVKGPALSVAAGSGRSTTVECPTGAFAVSGGFIVTAGGPLFTQASGPGTGNSKSFTWNIALVNSSPTIPATFHAFATCVAR